MADRYKREVEGRIEERSDKMVELLEQLVEAKTVTGNEKPGQEVIVEKLEQLGLAPDVWTPSAAALREHEAFFETQAYCNIGYDDRPNVAVRIPGKAQGRTLTLSGHMDVVPVDENEWTHDPWRLEREHGRLYGRGSGDMKGGIAAFIHAAECLLQADVPLRGELILQTTIEEEDGGVGGVLSALERGYRPDGAIIPEPKGIPNIGMASAGAMYFEITVTGASAHAARAYEGVNAFDKAIQVYEALRELDEVRKTRVSYEPAYRLNPELQGHETNLNIGMIEAGNWPATVPARVVLKGRIGWPPGETRAAVRDEIRTTLREVAERDEWLSDHPPQLEWFGIQAEPHEVSPTEELLQLAMENAQRVTGHDGVFYGGTAGNDTRYYKLYYDTPATSVGPTAVNVHGPDEYTTEQSLIETSKTIAGTIIDYCGVTQ